VSADDRRDSTARVNGFACQRCRDGAVLELQAEKIRGLSLKSEIGFAALRLRVEQLEAQLRASVSTANPTESATGSYVQVFYGGVDNYSESESVRAPIPSAEETRVVLRLPPCVAATSLRMDIGDGPALIEVYRLAFEANGGAVPPRELLGEELKRTCVAQGTSQAVSWSDDAFMQLSTGEDPQLVVQIPDILKAMPSGCRLRVDLRVQPLAPF
jgi:hypothetical protein